jgi:hypothetical protein
MIHDDTPFMLVLYSQAIIVHSFFFTLELKQNIELENLRLLRKHVSSIDNLIYKISTRIYFSSFVKHDNIFKL